MKKLVIAISLQALSLGAFAQTIIQRDTAITGMVSGVSADSLKSYVEKLVSFGTRNTLSTQKDPKRGLVRRAIGC
jgi:energy-converting hydrogenase Eha subunit A